MGRVTGKERCGTEGIIRDRCYILITAFVTGILFLHMRQAVCADEAAPVGRAPRQVMRGRCQEGYGRAAVSGVRRGRYSMKRLRARLEWSLPRNARAISR